MCTRQGPGVGVEAGEAKGRLSSWSLPWPLPSRSYQRRPYSARCTDHRRHRAHAHDADEVRDLGQGAGRFFSQVYAGKGAGAPDPRMVREHKGGNGAWRGIQRGRGGLGELQAVAGENRLSEIQDHRKHIQRCARSRSANAAKALCHQEVRLSVLVHVAAYGVVNRSWNRYTVEPRQSSRGRFMCSFKYELSHTGCSWRPHTLIWSHIRSTRHDAHAAQNSRLRWVSPSRPRAPAASRHASRHTHTHIQPLHSTQC